MNELALKFNEKLKEDGQVKEYLRLKEALKNNAYVQSLINKIKEKQQKLKAATKDKKLYLSIKDELEELKKELYSIPEVNNYLQIKEEVYDLIAALSKIIGE